MDDKFGGKHHQEIGELMSRMDEDAQAAMYKLAAMLSSLPQDVPHPSQKEVEKFVEQARLENIRIRLRGTVGQVLAFRTARPQIEQGLPANESWIAHAYPLHQVIIKLQGTRHSSRDEVLDQLEIVLARINAGDQIGTSHDDDFGYHFEVKSDSRGASFFDTPSGEN